MSRKISFPHPLQMDPRMYLNQHGNGFLGDAYNYIKKNKVVSKLGKTLGSFGVPGASKVGEIAGTLGFGKQPLIIVAGDRARKAVSKVGKGRKKGRK